MPCIVMPMSGYTIIWTPLTHYDRRTVAGYGCRRPAGHRLLVHVCPTRPLSAAAIPPMSQILHCRDVPQDGRELRKQSAIVHGHQLDSGRLAPCLAAGPLPLSGSR